MLHHGLLRRASEAAGGRAMRTFYAVIKAAPPHGAARAALWPEAPRARVRDHSPRRRLPRARLSRSRPPRLGRPPDVACDRLRRA